MGGSFSLDIELTNRCNAKCHFCPRDATPHQGTMTPEVFNQSLVRAQEFQRIFPDQPVVVTLCGLGEPLLNRHAATFVRQVRESGFTCEMASNAALLDETRGRALLEAGLQKIHINVADQDERYEEVYKLPFQRTHDNVVRFAEMAGEKCEVEIILVDYRNDREHLAKMRQYWRERGVTHFLSYNVMNRGGALFVDHMQFEAYPELAEARALLEARAGEIPICAAPFVLLFVGYDGQYYLCCSDWKKEVPLGSVFDTSFFEIRQRKLEHVTCREPICKTCNHDPINRMTELLRSINQGEADGASKDTLIETLVENSGGAHKVLEQMDRFASMPTAVHLAPTKRRIPIHIGSLPASSSGS